MRTCGHGLWQLAVCYTVLHYYNINGKLYNYGFPKDNFSKQIIFFQIMNVFKNNGTLYRTWWPGLKRTQNEAAFRFETRCDLPDDLLRDIIFSPYWNVSRSFARSLYARRTCSRIHNESSRSFFFFNAQHTKINQVSLPSRHPRPDARHRNYYCY